MKFYFSLILIILCSLAATISAQEKDVVVTTSFYGKVPPIAVDIPLPTLPEVAKKSGYGGVVSVGVTLDEKGKVISIDNVFGPSPYCSSFRSPQIDALRQAASTAALSARFKPSIVDGQGVSVKGRINYDFRIDLQAVTGREYRLDRAISSDSDSGARVDTNADATNSTKDINKPLPKMISGGVLNGKAIELATPSYPPAALAVRASGAVSVQVVISEDGTIRSASAVSGHPLLRSSSEIAACSSRFSPTLLLGQPVKVSGVITYNFNL